MSNIRNFQHGLVIRLTHDTSNSKTSALVVVKETEEVCVLSVHRFSQVGDILELEANLGEASDLDTNSDKTSETYRVTRNLTQREEVAEAQVWLSQVTFPINTNLK